MEIFIPLGGLIDLHVEADRLLKRKNELNGIIENVRNKLNNQDFITRAPEKVVQKEREKLEEILKELEKVNIEFGDDEMKKILIFLILLSQVWGQSVNASLTIYKDGFGLVKQPVSWDVKSGNNTIQYDRLTNGMFTDSPFLDLNNIVVQSQRLNQDIFSSNNYFKNRLGEKIELKLSNEKTISGTLLEYNSSQVTIQTKSNIQSFSRNNLDYISIKTFR